MIAGGYNYEDMTLQAAFELAKRIEHEAAADRRENYVKRCVGLPGQTLQIKNHIVYLNGKARRSFGKELAEHGFDIRVEAGRLEEMYGEMK